MTKQTSKVELLSKNNVKQQNKSKDYTSYQTDLSVQEKSASHNKQKQSVEFEQLNTQFKNNDDEFSTLLKYQKNSKQSSQHDYKDKPTTQQVFIKDDDLADFNLSDENSFSNKSHSQIQNEKSEFDKDNQFIENKKEFKNIFTQQKFAKSKTEKNTIQFNLLEEKKEEPIQPQ